MPWTAQNLALWATGLQYVSITMLDELEWLRGSFGTDLFNLLLQDTLQCIMTKTNV